MDHTATLWELHLCWFTTNEADRNERAGIHFAGYRATFVDLLVGILWTLSFRTRRPNGSWGVLDGPWLEDLFLVFVCRDGNWWECPFGAMGVPGVLSQFEEVWHAHLTVTLGFSTQYKSRIMWPKELADNELYQFTKGGWLDRMITQGMPATRDLRPEVKEYVAATGNNESNRQ